MLHLVLPLSAPIAAPSLIGVIVVIAVGWEGVMGRFSMLRYTKYMLATHLFTFILIAPSHLLLCQNVIVTFFRLIEFSLKD